MKAEIERLLVGAVLASKDPKRLFDASGLTPEDFSDAQLRGAFDLARRRADRHLEVSAITVWSTGRASKRFLDDDLGWLSTLEATNALDERTFLKLAEDFRTQIRGRQLAARLREVAAEVERPGYHAGRVSAQLDGFSQSIARTYQANRTAEHDPAEILEEWERRVKEGKPLFTPTGIPVFDQQFGGYVPNFNLVAGPPSIGKSALVASGIKSQLDAGMRVGLFGLEDGHRWLSRRYIAHKLGLKVRDVGNLGLDAAGWMKAHDAGAELAPTLRNLLVYKWGGATADEICRWALSWIINEGCQCIYIDNASEMSHASPRRGPGDRAFDFRIQVALSVARLRDFAERYQIPVVMLAHTTREYEEHRFKRPPDPSDTAEGAAFERKTRLFLGCWAKQWDPELRVTLGKMNEGEAGLTFGFNRHREAALLDLESGRLIDLQNETKKERREEKDRKMEESIANELTKAAKKAQAKAQLAGVTPAAPTEAAKPAEPPPQLELLAPAPSDTSKPEDPKP